jgi:hypothetical protein
LWRRFIGLQTVFVKIEIALTSDFDLATTPRRPMPTLFQQLDVSVLTNRFSAKESISRIVWGFVWLGVIARLLGYLVRKPLCVDECMLAEHFLNRGYRDLAVPLLNGQMAPVGFLSIELTCVKLFGFSEWSLRLFPLLCGIGGLFLFRHLASRLLTGVPLALAVGCLAVAKGPVGLSYDVKPYSCDLAVALVLLILAVECLRNPQENRWLLGLAAAVPIVLFLSFPAVFVCGAISLGLLMPICRRRDEQRNYATWSAYLTYNFALGCTFAAVIAISANPDAVEVKAFMEDYWSKSGGFPPIAEPLRLALWMVDVHLGEKIFAIPYGSDNGGGAICFVCCAIGAIVMYRGPQRHILTIFLAMFGLCFVAAVFHRYPYGGHFRLVQFLVPAISVTAGLGAAALLGRIPGPHSGRLAWGLMLAMTVFCIARSVREAWRPWDYHLDQHHREFARWFWQDDPHWITICAQTDLRENFSPSAWDSYYRCNQQIYSKPHHSGRRLSTQMVDDLQQPFKLVVYHAPRDKFDVEGLDRCLQQFESRYERAGCERYQMPLKDNWFDMYGWYEVFRFIPRRGPTGLACRPSTGD